MNTPTLAEPDCAELERLLAAATKESALPWEVDTEHDPDGEYGSGPDRGRGYNDFIVFDAKGLILFGTANSNAKCIDEELHGDEDGYREAWDATGKANTALAVAAVNALPALLAERKALREALRLIEREGFDQAGIWCAAVARKALKGASDAR